VFDIVSLTEIDPAAIEALLDAAFEPGRKKRTSYAIRADKPWSPSLSYAAVNGTKHVLGLLQSTPVALFALDGTAHPLSFVGPMAVHPAHQGQGVGRALMDTLLRAEADAQPGTDAFAVIGDPAFFARFFGFSADLTTGWRVPGPVERHRLLAKTSRGRQLPLMGSLGAPGTDSAPFALARGLA